MRFTEHEMVFFNSITKGNDVFGIPLKFRTQKSHEEEVKKVSEKTIKNFHTLLFPLMNKIKYNLRENTKLEDVRDSLLPKLMSGEIRVPMEAK